MKNAFVTRGAIAFITMGLSRGVWGVELIALGGLGGLAGGLLFDFDESSASE